jgi:plasmid stability protein
MKALHIRDVPEPVVAALKRRAAAHHRSLQKELLVVLEAAAAATATPEPEPLRLNLSDAPGDQDWSREAQYEDDGD